MQQEVETTYNRYRKAQVDAWLAVLNQEQLELWEAEKKEESAAEQATANRPLQLKIGKVWSSEMELTLLSDFHVCACKMLSEEQKATVASNLQQLKRRFKEKEETEKSEHDKKLDAANAMLAAMGVGM